jgi:polyisoprenoid-binding protein YceI
MKFKFFVLACFLFAFSQVPAQTSKVISGSTDFSVKFILGTCNGKFDAPKGGAIFDPDNLNASAFNLTISAGSFKTNSDKRDKDMKSDAYFNVAKYPDIHFKSSKIEKKADKYQAIGTLTIKDVSKTVTFPFDAKKNADGSYVISSIFDINRLDYKIGKSDWKLKDVVTVTIKAVIK